VKILEPFSPLTILFLFTILALAACETTIPPIESPGISVDPESGGPGTIVLITGHGFPAHTPVEIRLGPPDVGATPQSYAETISNIDGEFELSFTMPAEWPDGSPILIEEMVIAAINNDASIKSTIPFRYQVDSLSATFALDSRGAGRTPSVPEVQSPLEKPALQMHPSDSLERFQDRLAQALTGHRFDELQQLMGDRFTIAIWKSGEISIPPEQAIELFRTSYLNKDVHPILPTDADLPVLPGNIDPWTLFGPDMAGILFIQGWGKDGGDQAFLYIAQRPDGSYFWSAFIFAPGGFQTGS
jgi:hypothetical protein